MKLINYFDNYEIYANVIDCLLSIPEYKYITMHINKTNKTKQNKAVLEPRVSPAFAITYFCNHCNIRFENTSKYVDTLTLFSKNLNQRSLTPR